jgi:hypothetical protein
LDFEHGLGGAARKDKELVAELALLSQLFDFEDAIMGVLLRLISVELLRADPANNDRHDFGSFFVELVAPDPALHHEVVGGQQVLLFF